MFIFSNTCLCYRCDNELYGCSVVVKLDTLSHHLKECEHNPKKPVPCSQGCGLTVPKDEMVTESHEHPLDYQTLGSDLSKSALGL